MKKILRYLLRLVLSFAAFVVLYLATAFCLSRITVNATAKTDGDITIYIKTNGVHTDIVVPVSNELMDWSKQIKYINTTSKDSSMRWLGVGWGDKGFYLETPQWKDLKFSVAFKAAFALGESAMHATFYSELVESEKCKKISITKEVYRKLIVYIEDSFEKDTNGNVMPIVTNANYGNSDAFYEGTGKYSMFKTCNTWANGALKKSGLKACLWTAFDTPIFLKYEK